MTNSGADEVNVGHEVQQKKYSECLQTSIVDVYVRLDGAGGFKVFPIHSGLLENMSGFFSKALKSNAGVTTKSLELNDVNPEIFNLFVQYLYLNDWSVVPFPRMSIDCQTGWLYPEGVWLLWAELYLLGEKLEAPPLQSNAFAEFKIFRTSNHPKQLIYELLRMLKPDPHTAKSRAGLRHYVLEYVSFNQKWFEHDNGYLNLLKEFPQLESCIHQAKPERPIRDPRMVSKTIHEYDRRDRHISIPDLAKDAESYLIYPVRSFEPNSDAGKRIYNFISEVKEISKEDMHHMYIYQNLKNEPEKPYIPYALVTMELEILQSMEMIEGFTKKGITVYSKRIPER